MTAPRIGDSTVEAQHSVTATIHDAEPRTAHGRTYMPRRIAIAWRRGVGKPLFEAGWVALYGPQIRKDGSAGTREVNETLWVRAMAGQDGIDSWPGWVQAFFYTNRPNS